MRSFLAIACLLGLNGLTCAQSNELPEDLPPVIAVASAKTGPKKGIVELELTMPSIVAKVVGEVEPKKSWPNAQIRSKPRKLRVKLDPKSPSQLRGSTVSRLDGSEVGQDELVKLLQKPASVLVVVTGKKLDSFYKGVFRKDVLVVTLGPRDGAPNLSAYPEISKRTF